MRPALWFALLIALSGTADAIFEEQAGQVDWNKQNIGRILHAELAFRGRERVFVATSEGVVASLDTRDGSIAWRQVHNTICLFPVLGHSVLLKTSLK